MKNKTKDGHIKLYDLKLTSNQVKMIDEYAIEMGYVLVEDFNIPFICCGNKRMPIQLINGQVIAVANEDRYDLIQTCREMRSCRSMLKNMNVKEKAGRYLLKGACSLLPLEL